MGIIKAFKLGFDYLKYDEDGNVEATQRAVNDVNLDIEAGDFVAVLGHNGSEIGIDWPFEEGVELIISEKDKKWSGLKDTFKFNEEK